MGLDRTGVELDPQTVDDMAKIYMASEDANAIENTRPLYQKNSVMIASGRIYSFIDDLLVFYRELLDTAVQPMMGSDNSSATGTKSPLKQLATILSGRTFLPTQRQSILERTYGLGWVRTQLPGELGVLGLNPWLVKKMPIAGRVSPSRLTIYHQGNVPGATSPSTSFPKRGAG